MNATLLEQLARVSFPTLGHFLDDGFADHGMHSLLANVRMIGRVITLQLADADAIAVNRALARIVPGDVLVIDMQGDHAHAPVGAVTATAAGQAGAAGVVIDGVATDVPELRGIGLPVFARGTSVLTTKRHGLDTSRHDVPVRCGGVRVEPGMIALGDDNGLLFAHASTLHEVIETALASDRAEPAILARLRANEPVESVLGVVR
ncbi:RraA family protein [Caballeronia ptereochthonis]|uniref:Putative 4-hydroxy-4-methyl-2-oxoglutarate aldolase n=1 Tax=Caballeronia ptereochthonis TaxID=1777144 RepID=A0A158E9A2_9BURK|nr:RraA family protein [Caballeronia ptereochthonis]SAL03481.1 diguanylate cyclase [Caballeronia ptereochthonis]